MNRPKTDGQLYTDALRLAGLAEAFTDLTNEGRFTNGAMAIAATVRDLAERLCDDLDFRSRRTGEGAQ